MNDAAGSASYYYCPNCEGIVRIFSRSFAGQGKKCPHCKCHIPNVIYDKKLRRWIGNKLEKVITYTDRTMCPVCKKKMAHTGDMKDEERPRYCKFQKEHPNVVIIS